MSHVSLPSENVKDAFRRAAERLDADRERLIARNSTYKRWSWFRRVEAKRYRSDALRWATENTLYGILWMNDKKAYDTAYKALVPLLNVAATVEVSAEHFAPIAEFYRQERAATP